MRPLRVSAIEGLGAILVVRDRRELIAGIQNGTTYLNIHTVINPGGEIRAQLEPVPEPATLLLFGSTMVGLGLAARRSRQRRK